MLCPAVVLLKVTLLDPGVNVPPLLVQLPGRLIAVIEPAANVPEVSVIAPLRVRVAVLATPVNDPAPLFTAKLLKVWIAAEPVKLFAVAPSNVTRPDPGVNVPPLLVQLPAAVMFAPAVNVPAVRSVLPLISKVAGAVKVPSVIVKLFMIRLTVLPPVLNVDAPPLLTAKLLNVWLAALPLMVCPTAPSNVTRPEPGVNVPPLFVQLPAAVIVVPAVNVPADKSVLPLISSVAGAVKVPSVIVKLFMMRLVVLPPVLKVLPLLTMTLLNVVLVAVPLIS